MSKSSRSKKRFRLKAFTLIELLVVMSIISLLSSVGLVSVSQVRTKVQVSRAQQEMRQIVNAITIARDQSDKLMWEIDSGAPMFAQFSSACTTACLPECSSPNDLRNTSGTCYTLWSGVLDAIEANSGGIFPNLDIFRRDVWGSPYVIDENEGTSGYQCGTDYIRSGGPDGIQTGGGDDVVLRVPFRSLGKVFPLADPGGGSVPTYALNLHCRCDQPEICTPI